MSKKKAIILQHNGRGQLANQLWNFISIYTYSLEKGYTCRNYSFFEYAKYFNIPVGNWFIKLKFFINFQIIEKIIGFKLTQNLWRKAYKLFIILPFELFLKNKIIFWSNSMDEGPYYLPPSKPSSEKLLELENSNSNVIYFHSWLFRNPEGMKKYRKEILEYFKPKEKYFNSSKNFIDELRKRYSKIIGVHVRQKDYGTFKSGKYFIIQDRVREIINEYVKINNIHLQDVCFVICSDGEIREENFIGLNYKISNRNLIEDLLILSMTDVIIGSDSSFGNLSSYFGNIPHIVFQKDKIDWSYYSNKKEYFENKYCTMVHY